MRDDPSEGAPAPVSSSASATGAAAIVVRGLAKRFGDVTAVAGIDFVVPEGSVVGLLGGNGAGKSTTIAMLLGLLLPSEGEIRILGVDMTRDRFRALPAMNFSSPYVDMPKKLTVRENLAFWQTWLGDFPGGRGLDIEAAAEAIGLSGITHLPFGYLSAGQQRRFAIAKLLVAYRPIWILDEPTAALDVAADRLFAGLVTRHLEAGGLVLAATHQPLGLAETRQLEMKGFRYEGDYAA